MTKKLTPKKHGRRKTVRKTTRKTRAKSTVKSGSANKKGKRKPVMVKKARKLSKKLSKPSRKRVTTTKKPSKKRIPKNVNKPTRKKRKLVRSLRFLPVQDEEGNLIKYISNFMSINTTARNFEGKLKQIREWDGEELDYYIFRDTLFPRAFQIILTTKEK